MSFRSKWRSAYGSIFQRNRVERELDREMAFHLEMEAAAQQRAGVPAEEARAAATRSFGAVQVHKDACRDSWGTRLYDQFRQDLRFGFRSLKQSPGFTAAVVLTLGLGIGANTAIFSVVNGILLHRLPYADSRQIELIQQDFPRAGLVNTGFSVPEVQDYRERTHSFDAVAEYHSMWFILLGRKEPERVQTGVVSANFFDLLGVKPALGRLFRPGEDAIGSPALLVLSHEYWLHSFGGDPHVVGQVFEMNDRPHTVIGVLPPLPSFPNADQVFMPASACPFRARPTTLTNRDARIVANVFARVKRGVPQEQALADLRLLTTQLCGAYPTNYPAGQGLEAHLQPIGDAIAGDAKRPLLILLTTSGFVLLIACANVANLMLARLVRRDRELATRAALGAGRGRIVRQLLTESALLGLMGGAAGLLFAIGGLRLILHYAAHFLPRADEIAINGPVLLFTGAVALLTGLLAGSRPLLPGDDTLSDSLKSGGRGSSDRRGLRSLLVVAQVAISVPLLIGAGLAARSLWKLENVDPGLRTDHVLAASLDLNFTRYSDGPKRLRFWENLADRVRSLPGAGRVALSGSIPLNGLVNNVTSFEIEGKVVPPGATPPQQEQLAVSEGYFGAVGEPLLRGRTFVATDQVGTPPVTVINQSSASHYWPAEDPIGKRITPDHGKTWVTVVGVVANAREQLDQEPTDEGYFSFRQFPLVSATLLVNTSGDPATLRRPVRDAVYETDPQQPITRLQTLEEVRAGSLAPRRLIAALLALFAGLALAITAVGVGGVLAFTVSQRTKEIGIRMALGAPALSVVWLVLRQGLLLTGFGLTCGLVAALYLTQLMTALLYATPPTDIPTFALVTLTLLTVASVACLLPAHRATRIRPATVLQSS